MTNLRSLPNSPHIQQSLQFDWWESDSVSLWAWGVIWLFTNLFSMSVILLFQECYINGIVQYIIFWDWFFVFVFVFTQNNSLPNAGIPWRRELLATPVFLPGKSHVQRSWAGYSPWCHKELDKTEQLTLSTFRYRLL